MSTTADAELLDYDDVVAQFDLVLGLEVHVELSTAAKMFRVRDHLRCQTQHPGVSGLPGPAALPTLQRGRRRVGDPDRSGAELRDRDWCRFARKNYFYPDQPKNYQISRYDEPIAFSGHLDVPLEDGSTFRVDIERAHGGDTGKLTHVGSDTGRIHGATTSMLDVNRAGVPPDRDRHQPIEGAGDRPGGRPAA